MSTAYQCDRCESYDSGKPVLKVTIKTLEPPVKEQEKDLCPACLASIHDWLDAYKTTNP